MMKQEQHNLNITESKKHRHTIAITNYQYIAITNYQYIAITNNQYIAMTNYQYIAMTNYQYIAMIFVLLSLRRSDNEQLMCDNYLYYKVSSYRNYIHITIYLAREGNNIQLLFMHSGRGMVGVFLPGIQQSWVQAPTGHEH